MTHAFGISKGAHQPPRKFERVLECADPEASLQRAPKRSRRGLALNALDLASNDVIVLALGKSSLATELVHSDCSVIFFGLASAFLGNVKWSTPFVSFAWTFSVSMPTGSRSARSKRP